MQTPSFWAGRKPTRARRKEAADLSAALPRFPVRGLLSRIPWKAAAEHRSLPRRFLTAVSEYGSAGDIQVVEVFDRVVVNPSGPGPRGFRFDSSDSFY